MGRVPEDEHGDQAMSPRRVGQCDGCGCCDIRMLSEHAVHGRQRDVDPSSDGDVVDSAEHSQPLASADPAEIGADEPAVDEGSRRQLGLQPVADCQYRSADLDSAVGRGRGGNAIERDTVVDTPATCLGHAVRGDDPHVGRVGTFEQLGCRTGAADEHRVERRRASSAGAPASRRTLSWRGTSAVYRRGASRLRIRRVASAKEVWVEAGTEIHDLRRGPRENASDQNHQPADVCRGQREELAARSP